MNKYQLDLIKVETFGVGLFLLWRCLNRFFPGLHLPEPVDFTLTTVAILILPGLLMQVLIPDIKRSDWLCKLPIAFALSYSLWAIPSFLLMRLHSQWNAFHLVFWFLYGVIIILVIVKLWREGEIQKYDRVSEEYTPRLEKRQRRPIDFSTLVLLILLLGALFAVIPLSSDGYMDGDVLTHVALIRHVAGADRFSIEEPFFGAGLPVPTRGATNPWLLLPAFIVRETGIDPISLINVYLPPFMSILAVLTVYLFVNELSGNRKLALFTAVFTVVYLAAEPFHRHGNSSYILFRRIISDKHFLNAILLPVGVVFGQRYLRGGKVYQLALAGFAGLGIALTHALITLFFLITMGTFSAAYFLFAEGQRNRATAIRVSRLIGMILLMMSIPIVQSRAESGRSSFLFLNDFSDVPLVNANSLVLPVLSVPSMGVPGDQVPYLGDIRMEGANPFLVRRMYGQLKAEGLLILSSNLYMNHPDLLWDWGTLAGLLLTPILFFWFRRDRLALYLLAITLVYPTINFNPILAPMAGRFVTPWLLYRFTWQLPVTLTLAYCLYKLACWLESQFGLKLKSGQLVFAQMPSITLFLIALVLMPQIVEFSKLLLEKGDPTKVITPGLATFIQTQIAPQHEKGLEPEVILADYRTNQVFAARFDQPNLVAHRYNTTSEEFSADRQEEALQRSLDVDYFGEARRFDLKILDAIRRYRVDYVLVRTDRELACQLHYLPSLFITRYADEAYSLFEVKWPLQESQVVEANSFVLGGDLETAAKLLRTSLTEGSDSILANLIMGDILLKTGDPERALLYYQTANNAAPGDACGLKYLAEGYFAVGELDRAVETYQQAVSRAPGNPEMLRSLGDIYLLQERSQDAQAAYRESIETWIRLDPYSIQDIFPKQGSRTKEREETKNDSINTGEPRLASYYEVAADFFQERGFIEAAEEESRLARRENLSPQSNLAAADAAASAGRNDEAVSYLRAAIKADPNNSLSFIRLGELYQAQGQYAEALDSYQKAARISLFQLDWGLEARLRIGSVYKDLGEEDQAIQVYQQIAHYLPTVPDPYLEIAKIHRERGSPELAIEALRQAIRANPQDIRSYFELGDLYNEAGDTKQALDIYLRAVVVSPNTYAAWNVLAQFYLEEGRLEEARRAFDRSIEVYPANVTAYLGLASVFQKLGAWDAMMMYARHAFIESPKQSAVYVAIGDAYNGQNQIDQAVKAYQRAIQLNREDVNAYIKLADIRRRQGLLDEASHLTQTAMDANPASGSAMFSMANIYRLQGQYDQAVELYRQVIQKDPSQAGAFLSLGDLALATQNDRQAALELYREAVRANPEFTFAYLALGDLYVDLGEYELAHKTYEAELALAPDDINGYLALSRLQRLMGDRDAAKRTLQTAVDRVPETSKVYNALAEISLKEGDINAAEEIYQASIIRNPDAYDSYAGLAQLKQALGDLSGTRELLDEALRKDPFSAVPHMALALHLEWWGDLASAEEHLLRARELEPLNLSVFSTLGQFYQRQHRHREAIEVFDEGILLSPNDPTFYIMTADSYATLKEYDQALVWYGKAHNLDKSNPSPWLALSLHYQAQEDWESAQKSLESAMDASPLNPDVHLALGNLYWHLGQVEAAERQYQIACDLDREQPGCLISLGKIYATTGRRDQAEATLVDAIERSPLEPAGYIELGELYRKSGQLELAESLLNKGVEHSLDRSTALVGRGNFYASLRRWESAKLDYESAWKINSGSQSVGQILTQFLLERGFQDQALSILLAINRMQNARVENVTDLADYFSSRGDFQNAIQYYQSAIQRDPKHIDTYLGLARVYALLGYPDKEIETLQAATAAAPEDSKSWNVLGDAYLGRLDYSQAESAYRQAIELNPNHIDGYLRMDALRARMGGERVDFESIESRANLYPSPEQFISLGEHYQMQGSWDLAYEWYKRALSLQPDHFEAWLALGNYYQALGELEDALEAYDRAIQSQPNSSLAWLSKGSTLENLQQYEDAFTAYEMALDADYSQVSALISIARLQANIDQYDMAVKTLMEGLSRVPTNIEGYQVLSQIYTRTGNNEMAIRVLEDGLEQMPGAVELYASIGNFYIQQAFAEQDVLNFAQAAILGAEYRLEKVTSEERLVVKVIEMAEEAYQLAKSKLEYARRAYSNVPTLLEQANSAYEITMETQPGNVYALTGLGSIATASGDLESSLTYLEKAARENPQMEQAWVNLGNVYLEQGLNQQAVAAFRNATLISPANPAAQLGLVQAYNSLVHLNIQIASESMQNSHYSWRRLVESLRRNIPE